MKKYLKYKDLRKRKVKAVLNLNKPCAGIKFEYKTVEQGVCSTPKQNDFINKRLQWMHNHVGGVKACPGDKNFWNLCYIPNGRNNQQRDQNPYSRNQAVTYGTFMSLSPMVILKGNTY
ncbi:hypothetical protein C922_05842 [Plasmodium inui San Antonio 1]|uniref:Uncharacterized protein n=1 Tax=Plasmodium inui San Antonio 1 TaxID=1237626 RepID=W6ZS99_9APIC|nr:hypothetical protein C922_05842 [Plasmodium inui San Antonio 1]EUD63777.1 hypothetical protein C922_05842 [Plasmodium inui San Antonio 1]